MIVMVMSDAIPPADVWLPVGQVLDGASSGLGLATCLDAPNLAVAADIFLSGQ
ncbi:hypothetical protein HYPSUDRAFT_44283 [Hypholoma sublateritium FD-334 SS-4]|uniref:Uncharacterized protein n=1 Tax=Hypholoma sublateritium (strain FD-334 SS-4) TaxID=945553 RepID=A0A0D2M872_HYPSF|nr:hypothetical protein HYPSUDRAFT_44283 [Hypholoma sublateritium FD-334 SS-4]